MGRIEQPANLAQAQAALQRVAHLVELELDPPTGAVRMCTAPVDITWAGVTWHRGGHLLGFDEVEETAALLVSRVNVALSGVDQSVVALVLQEQYLRRPLRIYRAWLDATQQPVAAPQLLFDGRIDRPVITEDPEAGTSTVAVSAANAWVDFENRPGRRTNHEQQQVHFPGDLGFQYAHEIFKDLPWGAA